MDSMHSTNGKTRISGHSLTNSSYNISSGIQSGGRVVLTTDEGLHLDGSVPCWSDTRH